MFKTVLKDLLKEKNLSQEKFAKLIGTTQGTVSKWLSGAQEPRYSQLIRIAKTLNIDANVLLGLEDY